MSARSHGFGVRTPGFLGNRLAEWSPGAAGGAGQVFGWTFTLLGTSTVPAMTVPAGAGDLRPQIPRMNFASATSANALAGLHTSISQQVCWRGNQPGSGYGGFHFGVRFALSANVAGSRAFVGLNASGTSSVLTNPGTVANAIGIGFDTGDGPANNTWKLFRSTASAFSKTDIAGSNRNTTAVFDLSIISAPSGSSLIVRLVELNTGIILVKNEELTGTIPASDVFLYAHAEVGNASTGVATGIDVFSMFLDVPDGARSYPAVLGADGIYNVRDFGAVGDGTTPDDLAFRLALSAMRGSRGGTLLVPPGRYKLNADLVIDAGLIGSVALRGVAPGSGGHNQSTLVFAAYKGIRVLDLPQTPSVSRKGTVLVEDLDIVGGHGAGSGLQPPEHPVWLATTMYAPGTKVLVPGPRATNPSASFEYYYENIRTVGAQSGALANKPAFEAKEQVDPSAVWTASTIYQTNEVVRPTAAFDRYDRMFVCSGGGGGASGAAQPAWNFTLGATTNDGGLVWTAVDAAPYRATDGGTLLTPTGPVWACRVAPAIHAQSRVIVSRVYAESFLNAGLHIQGPPSGAVQASEAEASSAYDLKVTTCGCGIVNRDDAKWGTFVNVDISLFEVGGWTADQTDRCLGISERSTGGNTYVGGHIGVCQGPGVYLPGTTNTSTFFALYNEISVGALDIRSPKSSVWAGQLTTLAPTCAFYGAPFSNDWRNVEAQSSGAVTTRAKLKPDAASVYGFSSSDDATEYKLTYGQPATGWWGLRRGTSTAIAYSGNAAAEGGGFAWTPNGLFVGPTKVLVTNAAAKPTTGFWRAGDVVINRNAAIGQPSYWVCTVGGNPPTFADGPVLT